MMHNINMGTKHAKEYPYRQMAYIIFNIHYIEELSCSTQQSE